jgi:hypothetical protein
MWRVDVGMMRARGPRHCCQNGIYALRCSNGSRPLITVSIDASLQVADHGEGKYKQYYINSQSLLVVGQYDRLITRGRF